MNRPLVTTVDGAPAPAAEQAPPEPTMLIVFNEKSGASQVVDIIATKHAFVVTEIWKGLDENDREAWVLVVTCETASSSEVYDLIGKRLPDYIRARQYPPSRLAELRRTGERVS
ncbi:MAG: hypothetical protein H7287_10800 [Thermoleophilia bacterium]|nr:hypothetical protein [Thermoleophilia bacterium]